MARSRNKHSRAALRARARSPQRRGANRWFMVTVTTVVLVGVLGVALAAGLFSRGDSASAAAPAPPAGDSPGDHWHAAFAVNVCGEWLSNPAEFETAADNPNVRTGIHTHGDGFIHIHPFFASEGGGNATLGKFLDYGGWSASEDAISVWEGPSFDPAKTTWRNGDVCPDAEGNAGTGAPGRVVFEVNCKTASGDPSAHKLADQEVVALGFVPKGVEIGPPPNAQSAPDSDGSPSAAIDQEACRPSAADNPGVEETVPTTAAATEPTTQP